MNRLVIRLGCGILMALAVCGGAFAAPSAGPTLAATSWQIQVGGGTSDGAVDAQAFLPTHLTVNVGDTITWLFRGFHTVSFLSGGKAPDLVAASPEGPLFNPAVAFPSGGPAYDGTGYVNSGALPTGPNADKFALTFTKAGTYPYICILHPGMDGQVVVQAADTAYPETQATASARGQAELYSKLSNGNSLIQNAKLAVKPAANGALNYAVDNGIGGNQTSVVRFLPTKLTVKAGDSVTWTQNDPHEIHTVTFYDPAGKPPVFTDPQPQANGPPKIFLRNVAPAGASTVDRVGFYNSGIMAPGQSYTLSFSKPGTYQYLCTVHAELGQLGTIVVTDAGASQPAQLPNTGTGPDLPMIWPGLAAVCAAVLGLLLRRKARALIRRSLV